jgi:hypothetical protein
MGINKVASVASLLTPPMEGRYEIQTQPTARLTNLERKGAPDGTASPPTKTPTTRDWGWITILGKPHVVCYPSTRAECHVVGQNRDGSFGLVMQKETSTFHDETLARATREINSILTRVVKENDDPDKHLHFIGVSIGLLLAWAAEVADKT